MGGGGHARVVLSMLKNINGYRLLGYTDLKDHGQMLGVPYLGTDAEVNSLLAIHSGLQAVLGVGQVGLGGKRQELWSKWRSLPLTFPVVVSQDAIISEGAMVGEATQVMVGAVINCGATLGRGVIVNTNSTVEHDVQISDWVHIGPGATICGDCKIGRHSMVGAGATVIQGISIAENCLVGAGATVVRDITEPGVYGGCPALRIN